MKKKTLIIPTVLAMLAVSCGGSTPGKDWSKEIKDFMSTEMGEVLPYLDLDAESLYYVADSDEFGGHLYLQDDNETDLVADYGEKLVTAGFVFNEEAEAYYKTNDKCEMKVSLEYFKGSTTSSFLPGNIAEVFYLYKNAPVGGEWSATVKSAMTSVLGVELPYAYFDADTTDVQSQLSSALEALFMVSDENESNKLASYPFRLEKAGFSAGKGTYGTCMIKETDNGKIGVYADWYAADDTDPAGNEIFVEVAYDHNYVDYFPKDEIEDFYGLICYYLEDDTEYSIPDFEFSSEQAIFYYRESYDSPFYADVYTYGTTSAELDAYAVDLAQAGWCIAAVDGHDYMLYIPDTYFRAVILDYSADVDPDDPYTGNITFYYDQSFIGEYTNAVVGQTLAARLGLTYEVREGYLLVSGTVTGTDLAAVRTAVQAAIPGLNSYYFWSEYPEEGQEPEDGDSYIEYDKEDPTKVVAYIDYYFVDGWEPGNQLIYTAIYPSVSDPDVETAIFIQIAGEPVVKEWTAYKAILEMTKLITPEGYDPAEEIEDYSDKAGYPAFGTSGLYTYPVESIKAFPEQLIVGAKLKGFEKLGDWEQDPEDGTWSISYSNGKVTLKFWVYLYNYTDPDTGTTTTYTVLEIGSYEYPETSGDTEPLE